MDIHLVRVPQYVDVVNAGESQRNEENIQHVFRSMLTAMRSRHSYGSAPVLQWPNTAVMETAFGNVQARLLCHHYIRTTANVTVNAVLTTQLTC